MSERYGYRYGEEPGGERPSGRGTVAERHVRQDEEHREIDLTDYAADREEEAAEPAPAERTAGNEASAPGPEAGEEEPRTGWETPGASELHPGSAPAAAGPASTAGSTSIFDVARARPRQGRWSLARPTRRPWRPRRLRPGRQPRCWRR